MTDLLQSLHCSQCGASPLTDNADGTVSCPYCGTKFAHPERVCPQCDTVNESDARQCVSCGQKLHEPCVRCGALNWVHASRCKSCGALLDMLEHLAARRAETTADRLHRFQAEMPALKEDAERASQARLDEMWAKERARVEALAKSRAERQRQERLIWTVAAAGIGIVLIAVIVLALIAQFR